MDDASDSTFKTRTPEAVIKWIDNLASSSSTKNADFERKKLAAGLNNNQMAEVKAKLDTVHNLLVNKKSVHFAQEVEVFEAEEEATEEDVNYVNGSGFNGQRFGTSQGNFRGYNNQRNNYGNNQNTFGFMPRPVIQDAQRNISGFTRDFGSSDY